MAADRQRTGPEQNHHGSERAARNREPPSGSGALERGTHRAERGVGVDVERRERVEIVRDRAVDWITEVVVHDCDSSVPRRV